MARMDVRICSTDGALQHGPKRFDVVGMDVPPYILADGMVHRAMRQKVLIDVRVKRRRIRVERGVLVDALARFRQKRLGGYVRDFPCANTATALHDSEDGRFHCTDSLRGVRLADAVGFVLPLSADEGFVRFDGAGERVIGLVLHPKTNAVQHEPRRLLRDLERPSEFVRRDTVTVARDQPNGGKPLVEPDGRVLKDRADLGGKDALAFVAVPTTALHHVRDLGRSTAHARARNAVRPAYLHKEIVRRAGVLKLPANVEHRLGNRLLIHA